MGFSRQEYWNRVPLPSPLMVKQFRLENNCVKSASLLRTQFWFCIIMGLTKTRNDERWVAKTLIYLLCRQRVGSLPDKIYFSSNMPEKQSGFGSIEGATTL